MRCRHLLPILIATALLGSACGGSDEPKATSEQRIERCLIKQPDATSADCEQWEQDGELQDDGTHEGHESMAS